VDAADGLSDSTLSSEAQEWDKGALSPLGTRTIRTPSHRNPSPWLNWITNTSTSSFSKGNTHLQTLVQVQGRQFFRMEEVPYRRVAAQLEQASAGDWDGLNTVSTNLLAADSFLDAIPAACCRFRLRRAGQNADMRLSRVDWDQTPALVLDYYVTVPGMPGDYSFQSGTTYSCRGWCDLANVHNCRRGCDQICQCQLLHAHTTWRLWEYGSGILIVVEGTLTCQTSSDNPAVFTAADDDNVGYPLPEPLSMHDRPANYYANPQSMHRVKQALIKNVRIRYAATGSL